MQVVDRFAPQEALLQVLRWCWSVSRGAIALGNYFITGIENSAPARIPVGHRDVTVFKRV